jgi:lipopolysaccharide export system protein LptA
MSIGRAIAAAILGLLCALALGAGNTPPPPQLKMPDDTGRSFTVTGSGLTVRPGAGVAYLSFSGPVDITGPDLHLSAKTVELDLISQEITQGQVLRLPKLPKGSEQAVRNPGKTAAEMAREMKIPDARFSESAIKRVGAAGGVSVTTKGISFETPALVSLDGGRSWTASGGCTVRKYDKATKDSYSIRAKTLVYDTQTQRASAEGEIEAHFARQGQDPLTLLAKRCEFDLAKGTLQIKDPLTVKFGSLVLNCGSLSADLNGGKLEAGGQPKIDDATRKLGLSASTVSVDIEKQTVIARGGVNAQDSKLGVTLTAGELSADIPGRVMVATGDPKVTRGRSVFSGKKITVRQQDGKTVVEVEGEQQARIDLEDTEGLAPGTR